MKNQKIEEHTPGYPKNEPEEHVMTEEEALAFLRSPAKEFKPEELHAVGIVPADTKEPPAMREAMTRFLGMGMKKPEQKDEQE